MNGRKKSPVDYTHQTVTPETARGGMATHYANAVAIYEVVATGTLSHYLSYHNEDGALGRVVQDCVEGLGACLESEREDEALREQILVRPCYRLVCRRCERERVLRKFRDTLVGV
jgi:hypothetical protein